MKNIILIGFMGTGKTAVARMLAKSLGYPFVDTDERIEYATGLKLSEVWKKYGERRFRSEEELVFKKLAGSENQIIAVGGGADLNANLFTYLGEDNFVVLLESTPDIIYQRLSRKNTRSMLGKKVTAETVANLLAEKTPVYAQNAHMRVNTAEHTLEEITEQIIQGYNQASK